MAIAHTVKLYLEQQQAPFEVLTHRHTASSLRSASAAHVPAHCFAKSVLLEDDLEHSHFLIALVPASHRVELASLSQQVGRPLHLATEEDAAALFGDCETGAIPALGPAYGVETIVDDRLTEQPELYFEAGDHEHLVRMRGRDLLRLLSGCAPGEVSRQM